MSQDVGQSQPARSGSAEHSGLQHLRALCALSHLSGPAAVSTMGTSTASTPWLVRRWCSSVFLPASLVSNTWGPAAGRLSGMLDTGEHECVETLHTCLADQERSPTQLLPSSAMCASPQPVLQQ